MEQINTTDVLFRGGGENFLCFFARKAIDVHWGTVMRPYSLLLCLTKLRILTVFCWIKG